MARKRMIDPDFFTDPDMLELPEPERLFYIALWCNAEDSGVIQLSAKSLAFRTGFLESAAEPYLVDLLSREKIIEFSPGFGWLKNFHKHQNVPKPSAPKMPLPPWIEFIEGEKPHQNAYKFIPELFQEYSRTIPPEEKLREVKRKEEKKSVTSEKSPSVPPAACSLAEKLKSSILRNNPNAKIKDAKWPLEIDRMMRLDERTEEQVEWLIHYCEHDDFWSGVVLSPSALRKNFDKIVAQARRKLRNNPLAELERIIAEEEGREREEERNSQTTGADNCGFA